MRRGDPGEVVPSCISPSISEGNAISRRRPHTEPACPESIERVEAKSYLINRISYISVYSIMGYCILYPGY